MPDDVSSEQDQSWREQAGELLEDFAEESARARDEGLLKSVKRSLDNWRGILRMDARLIFGINLIFLGIGTATIAQTTPPLAWVGWFLAISGGIGIIDAAVRRVVP